MDALKRLTPWLLLASLLPAVLQATTLVKMSTEQLAAQATDIVIGTCTSVRSIWVDRSLVTLATIDVSESLKGDVRTELTLVLPGGVDASRPVPIAVTYPDAPVVMPRDDVVLFLERDAPVQNGYQIVGFSQGKYSVVRDAFGRTLASPTRGLSADAVDLATFKRRIKDLVRADESKGGTEQ
ncbi:MAG: hypothetical protein ACREVN_06485 [Gammaproteobacteria bacterium]